MNLRDADVGDLDLLVDLLVEAVNWTGLERMTKEQVMSEASLSRYVAGWKRDSDFGQVAITDDGAPLGAVWCRLFSPDEPGYGFVSSEVPELSMAVLPGGRGAGVGGTLLRGCIEQARARACPGLSLSVEDRNDVARALYLRHHFRVVGRDGDSDTLLLDLTETSV